MLRPTQIHALVVLALLAAAAPATDRSDIGDARQSISLVRDVTPILVRHCQACHGEKTAENNYRLDTFERLLQAGDYQLPPVTPGNLDESEIYRLITSEDVEERMPKNGHRLSDAEIVKIGTWIESGARFDGSDASAPLRDQIPLLPHPEPPETYPTPVPITAMTFSMDGTRLLVGGYHELLVYPIDTPQLEERIEDMPQRIYDLEMSPAGDLLAVAGGAPGASGEVRLLPLEKKPASDSAAHDQAKVLDSYDDVFFAVSFRPDGKQIAAACADGSIRVYDTATGAQQLHLQNHSGWVLDVCFSPDGSRLATASRDQTAKVFDAKSGELLATYSSHNTEVRAAQFAPDGELVISAGGRRAHVWKVTDSDKVGELGGFGGDVYSLLAHGETIIAAGADTSARQFKLADRKQVRTFEGHTDWLLSLAGHVPSQRLATGSYDGTVTIWDLADGTELTRFVAAPR